VAHLWADKFRCLRFLCEPIATPPVRTSSPAGNFALSVGRQLIYWEPMTKETFTEWRRGAADEILPSIESMNQRTALFPLQQSPSVNALFDLRYAANLSAPGRQGCEWEINQTSRVFAVVSCASRCAPRTVPRHSRLNRPARKRWMMASSQSSTGPQLKVYLLNVYRNACPPVASSPQQPKPDCCCCCRRHCSRYYWQQVV
jgi:hypothetical protein